MESVCLSKAEIQSRNKYKKDYFRQKLSFPVLGCEVFLAFNYFLEEKCSDVKYFLASAS